MQLPQHLTYRRLLRFTLPSVIMMIITSIYNVVDGFFVSNFAGKTPFAAVNFIIPFLMILGSVGFIFGTGGGALIAKTMGSGDGKKANAQFSLIVYTSVILGVVLTVVGILFLRPIARLMGATGQMLEDSVRYGRIILLALPFFILQYEFQCLFATAGKPNLGLVVTIAAGFANILLDALFVAGFRWGLKGAAAATAISQLIGGIAPILYFGNKNQSLLRLGQCTFDGRVLLKTCTNGASELMSNISTSLVSMLYNLQLMRYAGEAGVAAYGVLMYVSMIFQAIFLGYSVGAAPIVSYHYGAQNHSEQKSLFKKSLMLTGSCSILMFIAGETLAKPLAFLFVGYDAHLCSMTIRAFAIFSFSFLCSGISIFGSAYFTALNDGFTSAAISFMRTLVFQCAAVMIFPLFWQLDGIWYSTVAAELLAVIVTIAFFFGKKKKYQY